MDWSIKASSLSDISSELELDPEDGSDLEPLMELR
jgi:hypothetical protein